MTLSIVILAAGQGKRMHSKLPKVLHRLAGKPLLEHVVERAITLQPDDQPIIIFGHQGETVRHALANLNVTWVEQTTQSGTGHAVMQALPHLKKAQTVLVLYGDVPLISTATLKAFIENTPKNTVGIITAHLENPKDFGRILRDDNHAICAIVEEKDLLPTQHSLKEINSGIYLFPADFLKENLTQLKNNNAQKEYYLTDMIQCAVKNHIPIHSFSPLAVEEILGVNDRAQLARLERYFQREQAKKFMQQGVALLDPERFDVRGTLTIGQDVIIDMNAIFEGNVIIGNDCTIGPNTLIRNTIIADGVEIKANSVIDGAEIANGCIIGPFARIRPGTILSAGSHIGNFVEIKNSVIGEKSKVNHLSYIGDSEIGKRVNIGAGTITCNYDGVNKHRTIIGDDAFIGSNTSLVAPIKIGEAATVGAGSTITRTAPAHQLTVCRTEQRSIENWKRPTKKET